MFGKQRSRRSGEKPLDQSSQPARSKHSAIGDVRIFFGIMFILSILELGFTVDSFIYLQRKHKWWSGSERARLGFLIFSAVRTIALSAVYVGFHKAQKWFHSMLHTVFLFLSTVFWVVSGILIHHMWGYKKCGGVDVSVDNAKTGLSECHEVKIIEVIAWVIAGVSVVATIPVVLNALHRRKQQAEEKHAAGHGGEKV